MVIIEIHDVSRGEGLEFLDEASAIVWLQDEIARWERVLGKDLAESTGGIAAPLQNWRAIKSNVDTQRKLRGRKVDVLTYSDYEYEGIVQIKSKIGRALISVFSRLGSAAANSAAIAAGLQGGELDWTVDSTFRGVTLFDWFKRTETELEAFERDQATGGRVAHVADRINDLTTSITKLDEMVTSIATTSTQQREQLDAELTTYKAEAVENWRKVAGQTETIHKNVTKAIASGEGRLEQATTAAQARVDAWVLAQDEQRQLEKPAKLWAERGHKHMANSDKWRSWSLGVGIGGLLLAVFIAVRTFQWSRPLFKAAILPGTPASVIAGAGTLRPTFHYELIFTGAITLAWLTMYLWAMRLLVRLYTTEHHLAIDASARAAMMEAYLGLIEANAANAADRPIVLQALFRPVQDGMVRDDGPPGITPAALLSALATSQGKGN